MTYFINDHNEKTSRPVSISDIPEITGISMRDFNADYDGDIEKLNADLYGFDFTTTTTYKQPTEA